MRCKFAVLAGLIGLALPLPAIAQSGAGVAAMSPAQAHQAASDELAAVVAPDTQLELQSDRLVEAMLANLFASDTSIQELETAYPGLRDALGAGLKPLVVEQAYQAMPRYRAELAALYRANLTTGEARSAAAAMRSPAFVAFTRAIYANVNYKATAGAFSKDRDVSVAELRSDLGAAGVKSGEALSLADQRAIMVFMGSPLGLKLRALNPRKLAIDAKWVNHSSPEADKAAESAVEQAMIAHIALTDPETAELMRQELAKPAP